MLKCCVEKGHERRALPHIVVVVISLVFLESKLSSQQQTQKPTRRAAENASWWWWRWKRFESLSSSFFFTSSSFLCWLYVNHISKIKTHFTVDKFIISTIYPFSFSLLSLVCIPWIMTSLKTSPFSTSSSCALAASYSLRHKSPSSMAAADLRDSEKIFTKTVHEVEIW